MDFPIEQNYKEEPLGKLQPVGNPVPSTASFYIYVDAQLFYKRTYYTDTYKIDYAKGFPRPVEEPEVDADPPVVEMVPVPPGN
ncbi:hypothetical protein ACTXT7_004880 [Hymenolepis weldensis]